MRRELTAGRLVWRATLPGGMLWDVKRPVMEDLPTEVELRRERADALKLAGRLLEEAALAWRAADEATRDARRKDLERRLWALVVQREAMGLRHHDDVWLVYGLPRSVQPQPHLGPRRDS